MKIFNLKTAFNSGKKGTLSLDFEMGGIILEDVASEFC